MLYFLTGQFLAMLLTVAHEPGHHVLHRSAERGTLALYSEVNKIFPAPHGSV